MTIENHDLDDDHNTVLPWRKVLVWLAFGLPLWLLVGCLADYLLGP
jgi:hypothetical protein